MASRKRLEYDLTANDNASAAFRKVADEGAKSNAKIESTSADATKQLGLLGSAAAALGPAAIPAGAAMAGALIGIAPIAGVAYLALKGIENQYKSGKLAGTQFGQNVAQLKTEITGLETVAAKNVMSGLNTGLLGVHGLMPMVNRDVGIYSKQLGDIIGHVGPGLVALFLRLTPLFQGIGDQLVHGSVAFEHWAATSMSVEKFSAYAQQELPVVESILKNLVVTVMHLVEGIAPMGGHSLSIINLFSSALAHLPVGVVKLLVPALIGLKVASTAAAAVDNLTGALRRNVAAEGAATVASGRLVAAEGAATAESGRLTAASGLLADTLSTGLNPAIAATIGMYYLLGPVLDKVSGNTGTFSDQLNTLRGKTLDAIPGFAYFDNSAAAMAAQARIADGTVRSLGGALDGVPRTVASNIQVHTGSALFQIAQLQSAINALHGGSVTEYLNYVNTYYSIQAGSGGPTGEHSGPGRAGGGTVRAGMAYTVGEYGQETFVPDVNGRIVPNSRHGGGDTYNLTINAQGSVDHAAARQIAIALSRLANSGNKFPWAKAII